MNENESQHPVVTGWRARVHRVIYEADTPAGKVFDVGLIVVLIVVVALVATLHPAGTAAKLYPIEAIRSE